MTAMSFHMGTAASLGPHTILTLTNGPVTPDGFTREAVLVNGITPGPPITGWKGDNFLINVVNELQDPSMNKTSTVHWHGLFQHHSNAEDGTAFVTQCPIASGNSFLYDFDVPDQAGTFWYHSHETLQYCDGLRGPLIVYDPDDPYADLYDIDDESTIITLNDWYHVPALQVASPSLVDSILINGLGRQANDTTSPLSVITVTQEKRYRFRLISMSCDAYLNFTIDNHTVTVIEADGQNTKPLPDIDSIQIFAAQRYSLILEANQTIGNYWIRAVAPKKVDNQGTAIPPPGMAILRYVGAPDDEPKTTSHTNHPLNESDLRAYGDKPVPGKPYPGGADVNIQLDFAETATGLYTVNNVIFIPPPVPVLLQIMHGDFSPWDLMPTGSVYGLPPNKSVEISMPGGVGNSTHPLHLHGHTFSVVRSAGQLSPNYDDPVRRDTVNIGLLGDNVTIRFDTNNPGPWFLHCHIDFHLYQGFAVVMAEDTYATPLVDTPPPEWDALCPIYNSLPLSDD
ncbi:multicopper oxidase [Laetiporus sulphureus 93-53]|uniref:laccase n=1 Tax=Laetiporus sulphureus 93-53 TaxID=1314785 RepID=A0A165B1V2_9APHY|nr:multicopper oxidase [Laetiporus sulphureus 93-53]KZT00074.1 multicopper oxidase [Laetiporus sulphureus 93-53]